MQAPPPSLELMSGVRRDICSVLDAQIIKGLVIGVDVAGVLAAAATTEHNFDLLLETGRVGDIRRSDNTAAQESDVRKCVKMFQGDAMGLHSAHGKADHAAMRLIGKRAEVGVNIWDQFVNKNRLESRDGEIREATAASAGTSSR